jgi:hypothetical protein
MVMVPVDGGGDDNGSDIGVVGSDIDNGGCQYIFISKIFFYMDTENERRPQKSTKSRCVVGMLNISDADNNLGNDNDYRIFNLSHLSILPRSIVILDDNHFHGCGVF